MMHAMSNSGPTCFFVPVPYAPRAAPNLYDSGSADSICDDEPGDAIPGTTTLLTLRRAELIHVLEFSSLRKEKMTAARLSVLSDVQLSQVAVILVGLKTALRSARSFGVRTFGGFKHMVKAIALEGAGFPSLAPDEIDARSRELGFDDALCGPGARKLLRRNRSTASAASTQNLEEPEVAGEIAVVTDPPPTRRRLRHKTSVHPYCE